ncbi:MAG: DUF3843 family protein [Tannerella sp.]|jgi:hypothetical protein|nr:DUF3843 family protein [Tannerella sp.]
MKSDIAVMQDWATFHPEASPTAFYYLRLCNRALKIILRSDLRKDFGAAERGIQLACILTAYFEDVISETGLFRIFTEQHGELYGKALPFYEVTEEYYPDEINLYDIYFLIWHSLSIWRKEDDTGMVDPFFRRGNRMTAIRELYDLYDSEFENAPQNENMRQFLRLSPRASVDEIRKRLDFLTANCYLGFIEHACFVGSLVERTEKALGKAEANEEGFMEILQRQEMLFYDSRVNYMFNYYFSLLAQRASEQLAHLAGVKHPLYPLLKDISIRKTGSFRFLKETETEFIVEHLPSLTRINLSKEYLTLESEQIIPDRSCITMGIVKWGDVWQQMGSAVMFDYSQEKEMDLPGASAFDDPEKKKSVMKEMGEDFLQAVHGKRIAFLKGAEELCDLYGRFLDIHTRTAKEKKKAEQARLELLAEINCITKKKDEFITFFINPETGIEYYFGDIITVIADPDNPFYIPGKTCELESLFFSSDISVEFINYLIENSLVTFTASETSGMEVSVMLDNRDFLLRYYKQHNYRPEPEITLKR